MRSGELRPRRCRKPSGAGWSGSVSGHPEKARSWAAPYKLPQKNIYNFENFDRSADNPDIDLVFVLNPPGTHRDFVIRAAKAGKHVISEKPLATTVADCDAMIAACAAAKVQFSVGYRLFFDPYHQELRRLAREQDFGVLKNLSGNRGFVFGKRAWRVDKKLGGGGPMMDLGIYIIQGACMATNGETPVSVSAHELPKKRPELFDEVEETMKFRWTSPTARRCDAIAGSQPLVRPVSGRRRQGVDRLPASTPSPTRASWPERAADRCTIPRRSSRRSRWTISPIAFSGRATLVTGEMASGTSGS